MLREDVYSVLLDTSGWGTIVYPPVRFPTINAVTYQIHIMNVMETLVITHRYVTEAIVMVKVMFKL
jgi:hypothetical protein